MLATGFFQVDCAVTLQRLGCLFVIEISSRYARVPGVTANPVGSRELLDEAAEGSPALDPLAMPELYSSREILAAGGRLGGVQDRV